LELKNPAYGDKNTTDTLHSLTNKESYDVLEALARTEEMCRAKDKDGLLTAEHLETFGMLSLCAKSALFFLRNNTPERAEPDLARLESALLNSLNSLLDHLGAKAEDLKALIRAKALSNAPLLDRVAFYGALFLAMLFRMLEPRT
jgi:hypothetical protein